MNKSAFDAVDEEETAFRRRVSASGLPIFSLAPVQYPDEYLIWDDVRPGKPKAVVITMPRSGTHFATRLLTGMGMVFGGLHLSPSLEPDIVETRRGKAMSSDGKLTHRRYRLPITDVFKMMGPGQFVQGHIPFRDDFAAALANHKIICVKRNLRNVAVSSMRFIATLHASGHEFSKDFDTKWTTLENGPLKMFHYLNSFGHGLPILKAAIEPWQRQDNAFTLDFDLLTGTDEARSLACLRDLAQFLDLDDGPEALRDALQCSIGATTMTWSGELSQWRALWNDEVERAFQDRVLQFEDDEGPSTPRYAFALPQMTEPQETKRHSVISWIDGPDIASRMLAVSGHGLRPYDVIPEIISSRLRANVAHEQVLLDLSSDTWILQGLALDRSDGWLRLSAPETFVGDRHLTVPIASVEALTITTLTFLLRLESEAPCLLVQLRDSEGFFSGVFDGCSMIITQLRDDGHCRNICARIDPWDGDNVRISLSGLVGGSAAPHIRIHLCDARGNLEFAGRATVHIRQVTTSYGMGVFDFRPPDAIPISPL